MTEETATKPVEPVAPTTDLAEKAAAFDAYRQQQHQRRPLNLLHCMDENGNIDAFRYIEYSRQRRLEFLKRADFICKMKSTLRMQHQHQQLLNRSASMPVMTSLPEIPSTMANEVFKTANKSGSVSPETTTTGGTAFSGKLKSLGFGGSIQNNKNNDGSNQNLPAVLATPAPVRLVARSASMPFVVSSFGTNTTGIGTNKGVAAPDIGSPNANFKVTPRPRLRKEEFEAAEALLFGMGRSSSFRKGNRLDETAGNKRRDTSSSDDATKEVGAGDGGKDSIGTRCHDTNGCSSKKRKVSDPPRGETTFRSEEMESVLSVVSTEDDSNGSCNSNDAVREDEVVTGGITE